MMYNAFVKQWNNSMRGHHTDREKGAKKEWKTLGANEKKKKKKQNKIKDDIRNPNEMWPLSTNRFYI